ncbi:MAG: hypothetical protein QM723_30145 [Myxococcaceae bacterium]
MWGVLAAAAMLSAFSCKTSDGKCTTNDNCTKGQLCCSGVCADPQTDRSNCGVCGTVCGTMNAASECVAGLCHLTCQSGFGNCNNSPLDGCETKLSDSPSNCGMCGHSCAAPHSQGACLNGQCASGACDMGFKDCNTSRQDGCETPVLTSTTDCGDCGKVCNPQHTTSGHCSNGGCQIGACETGFDNCDGAPGNGCEVDLTQDPNHCGDCTTVCDANLKCVGGHCTSGGLLLYGGLNDIMNNTPVDSLTSYEPATHRFLDLVTTGVSPGARFGHLAVWDGAANRMLVWGGFDDVGVKDTDMHALDFNQTPPAWSTLAVTTGTPSGRGFMEYGFDQANRVLYIFGGGDPASGSISETWKFDVATLAWTPLPAGGLSRSFGVNAFENGRFVVGLGMDFANGNAVTGFAAYDPDGGSWVTLTEEGTVPGGRAGIQTMGDVSPLVMFGGFDPMGSIGDSRTFIADESNGMFVLSSPSWTVAPPARAYAGTAAANGQRYLYGGYLSALGTETFDLWSLDLDGGWTLEADGGDLGSGPYDPDAGTPVTLHKGTVLPSMVAR